MAVLTAYGKNARKEGVGRLYGLGGVEGKLIAT